MNLKNRFLKKSKKTAIYEDFNPYNDNCCKVNRGKSKKEFIDIKNQRF